MWKENKGLQIKLNCVLLPLCKYFIVPFLNHILNVTDYKFQSCCEQIYWCSAHIIKEVVREPGVQTLTSAPNRPIKDGVLWRSYARATFFWIVSVDYWARFDLLLLIVKAVGGLSDDRKRVTFGYRGCWSRR